MYVKLVNPRTGAVISFECDGEVVWQKQDPMDIVAQETWRETFEDMRFDPRRFVLWPPGQAGLGSELVLTEIQIPGRRRTAVLTNWDAWLTNDHGHTIDRLHRHAPATAAAPVA